MKCPLGLLLPALNRKQRRAAAAEQVCKSADNDDQRKAKPDGSQCDRANLRDAGNVNAIHNVVQQIENLRHKHRQRSTENVLRYRSVFKINASHLLEETSFLFVSV